MKIFKVIFRYVGDDLFADEFYVSAVSVKEAIDKAKPLITPEQSAIWWVSDVEFVGLLN